MSLLSGFVRCKLSENGKRHPHHTALPPLSFPSCVRLYGHHVLREDWLRVRSRVASFERDNEPCRSIWAENFLTSKAAINF
jgi:hypothetical protein